MLVELILTCCIFSLAALATEEPDVSECSCSLGVTDCSYRMKTVFLESDWCRSSPNLNLRGNMLRQLPAAQFTGNNRIDASLNEIGMGPKFYITDIKAREIDLSSNYFNNLDFLEMIPSEECNVVVLNISNNVITELGNEFYKHSQFQIFRIANNRLSQLNNNSFSNLRYLTFLDLSGNPLQTVSPTAFHRLDKLETLDLSETHSLSSLAEETFSGLRTLRHLRLSGNKLTRLPGGLLAPLGALETLHLQRNGLQQLAPDAFRALVRLRVLDLDSNMLESLPPQLFERLHSLSHLSARANRLVAVPSLRLCAGPLRTALFGANAIADADEEALRALWRPGFVLGDLRDNPLAPGALAWARNASDVVMETQPVDTRGCSHLGKFLSFRLTVKGYGVIETCNNEDRRKFLSFKKSIALLNL